MNFCEKFKNKRIRERKNTKRKNYFFLRPDFTRPDFRKYNSFNILINKDSFDASGTEL